MLRNHFIGESKMDFVEIAKTDEIPIGAVKAFVVNGKDIFVARLEGNYYAMCSICTHRKGELAKGKIEGKIVTCLRHGCKFDITTGKCMAGSKVAFMRLKTKDEPRYEVKVDGNSIKVAI